MLNRTLKSPYSPHSYGPSLTSPFGMTTKALNSSSSFTPQFGVPTGVYNRSYQGHQYMPTMASRQGYPSSSSSSRTQISPPYTSWNQQPQRRASTGTQRNHLIPELNLSAVKSQPSPDRPKDSPPLPNYVSPADSSPSLPMERSLATASFVPEVPTQTASEKRSVEVSQLVDEPQDPEQHTLFSLVSTPLPSTATAMTKPEPVRNEGETTLFSVYSTDTHSTFLSGGQATWAPPQVSGGATSLDLRKVPPTTSEVDTIDFTPRGPIPSLSRPMNLSTVPSQGVPLGSEKSHGSAGSQLLENLRTGDYIHSNSNPHILNSYVVSPLRQSSLPLASSSPRQSQKKEPSPNVSLAPSLVPSRGGSVTLSLPASVTGTVTATPIDQLEVNWDTKEFTERPSSLRSEEVVTFVDTPQSKWNNDNSVVASLTISSATHTEESVREIPTTRLSFGPGASGTPASQPLETVPEGVTGANEKTSLRESGRTSGTRTLQSLADSRFRFATGTYPTNQAGGFLQRATPLDGEEEARESFVLPVSEKAASEKADSQRTSSSPMLPVPQFPPSLISVPPTSRALSETSQEPNQRKNSSLVLPVVPQFRPSRQSGARTTRTLSGTTEEPLDSFGSYARRSRRPTIVSVAEPGQAQTSGGSAVTLPGGSPRSLRMETVPQDGPSETQRTLGEDVNPFYCPSLVSSPIPERSCKHPTRFPSALGEQWKTMAAQFSQMPMGHLAMPTPFMMPMMFMAVPVMPGSYMGNPFFPFFNPMHFDPMGSSELPAYDQSNTRFKS